MSVVDNYITSLHGSEQRIIALMCASVRKMVPDATEEIYYAIPSFTYKGKGLVAIVAHKTFMSLYPFCGLERLELDFSSYKVTTGSIHFTIEHPITDVLLRQIIEARVRLITV